MDREFKRPADQSRLTARTSERVAGMTDDERADLARALARRKAVPRAVPPTRLTEPQQAERARAAARLTVELQKTERSIVRLERTITRSRYQVGTSAPTGRYARLLRRADRLERQLRALQP
jgi:hypothetical protein